MDMAVSDNQAKNDIAVNNSQQSVKEKPKPKKEDTEYLVRLKQKYLLEEGQSSERYRALARAIKNSEIN